MRKRKKILLFLILYCNGLFIFSQSLTNSLDTTDAFDAYKNKDYSKAVIIFSKIIG